jgi:HD superfamily phosphohydrolase
MRQTHIITDPVYQVMNFGSDPELKRALGAVIDTRPFERRRRISQLGRASYVFPGATHMRFSHCLGAADLAYTVLTHLRERADKEDEHKEIGGAFKPVIMAALLHDVGHGPFSHAFEQVPHGRDWVPDHEDWTTTMISHQDSDIREQLDEHHIDSEAVASMFNKRGTCLLAQPFRQIVSSQLDVDRMD